MLEVTVGAEIVLRWAPSLLPLLVVIVLIQASGSEICPLVSRAAAAVSMIPLLPTPVEGDFIWEVPVDLLVSRLLVVARSSLIESLFIQVPSQVRAEAVALLEGHIWGWVEDPQLLVSLALLSSPVIQIVEVLNLRVFSCQSSSWLGGQSLRA